MVTPRSCRCRTRWRIVHARKRQLCLWAYSVPIGATTFDPATELKCVELLQSDPSKPWRSLMNGNPRHFSSLVKRWRWERTALCWRAKTSRPGSDSNFVMSRAWQKLSLAFPLSLTFWHDHQCTQNPQMTSPYNFTPSSEMGVLNPQIILFTSNW